jgi:cell division protein FtsQ
MAVALIAGMLWARYKSQGETCASVVVQVINADSTSFVTPEGVLSDLEHQGLKFVGKRMVDINASDVEEILGESPYLEFADIVKCPEGRLLIRVSQLLPVLRVFDGEDSYYVNRAGKRMDASIYYHTDVPVVQGHFTKRFPATRLLPLIDYVESDSLLRALVSMYCVRDSNNIIIVPQISGHVINMGDASDFENKFAKLLLFYREVMPKRGWNTFDTISVKWNHQIVATRRVKAVVPTIEFDPEDDEQAPDIKTMDMTLLPKGSNEGNEQGNESDKKKEDEAAKPSTTTNSGNNNQAKPEKDKKKNN